MQWIILATKKDLASICSRKKIVQYDSISDFIIFTAPHKPIQRTVQLTGSYFLIVWTMDYTLHVADATSPFSFVQHLVACAEAANK